MPSQRTAYSAIPNTPVTKIFERNTARTAFSIYLASSQYAVYIADNPHRNDFYLIQPGEVLTLSAMDGDDCTQAYWCWSTQPAGSNIIVLEQILDPSVINILQSKGIETTQGLPYILLLAAITGGT